MRQHIHGTLLGLALWSLLGPSAAQASLLTFTDPIAFQMALSTQGGLSQHTLDFESPTAMAGDLVASGDTLGDITFHFALVGAPHLIIANAFDTTSGTQYLGLDDGNDQLLFSGDKLTLSFNGTRHAVGLFVVGTPGDVLDGDFVLSVGAGSVLNATPPTILPDTGEAFFLGLLETEPTQGFTSAMLSSLGDVSNPFFFWQLDDITTAQLPTASVPEPGTLGLLLTGMVGLLGLAVARRISTPHTTTPEPRTMDTHQGEA